MGLKMLASIVDYNNHYSRRLLEGHVRDCLICAGRIADFDKTRVIFKSSNRTKRELVEVGTIRKAGDNFVSAPSITMMQKEIAFLLSREKQMWR